MRYLTLILAFLLGIPQMTAAEDSPGISIELNKADTVDTACRLTFVLNNSLESDVEKFVAETVLFSSTGDVLLLTLFDFGNLPASTLRVRQFQVPETKCDGLGQVLVNGTDTCQIAGEASDMCEMTLSSRVDIDLKG